ncbi:SRPBCC family protein [Streptomyces sp. RO-S4]|uniref:SRPBCC family protein n=1 Tax=unclassified Streptomyces TaxID=2593676 RepID=UPI00208F7576|nr:MULTISPECIES: SRPBCC family protein [unclassified Streptomyces]MCO4700524.1 SRPBCC family protein [Streptomyces sp. RO-S4]MDU0304550.1 SRPBCC family protein [Streptomyces sp. PAL114]
MPSQRVHSARRTVCVAAPAHVVYGMLADAPRWPVLLPSYVHVERMDFDGAGETLLAWEFEDGRVRSSRLRRTLRPREHCVDFEQDDPAWPGGTVAGSWSVEPDGAGRSLVTLRQQTPNAPAGTSAGPDGLDADAAGRLARLREAAERWDRLDELLLAFEERIRVEGPAELVYDFLYRVEDWPETLPHIDDSSVREDRPGTQVVAFDTGGAEAGPAAGPDGGTAGPDGGTAGSDGGAAGSDGGAAGSQTVRLCFPHAGRIVFKETAPPAPITAHSGEWNLLPDNSGLTVVCAHRVLLGEEPAGAALGAGALPVDARRQVRERLGRESRETLRLAKWHAESPVRRLR